MQRLSLPLLALLIPSAHAADDYSVRFAAEGSFNEVRDRVQFAIEGQGLNINHTNQIAGMLDRTGTDLGATTQVYTHAEQFEFCSASLSRAMMEADPHAVTLCPYSVSVYQLPNAPTVTIAYRKPPTSDNPALKAVLDKIELLLTQIASEAQ